MLRIILSQAEKVPCNIKIDFRKAFDLVNHNILLEKLASMNVNKSFWLIKDQKLFNRKDTS